MKPLLTVLTLALVPLAATAHAQSVDTGSFFPTLTFPEPAPEPVTRADTEADRKRGCDAARGRPVLLAGWRIGLRDRRLPG